jgi:shikimate dehydrogenase
MTTSKPADEPERFYFVGVSTSASTIMRLFPRWARQLDLDAEVVGRDVEIGAPPDRIREVVAELASDPLARGGLVTTHKIAVFDHARDLFADIDPYARLCGEISCLSKRAGSLVGHAKDPITAARALDEIVDPRYFSTSGSEVLCLGAGGAGLAITLVLRERADPPRRIILTDVDEGRLAAALAAHDRIESPAPVRTVRVSGTAQTDELVRGLGPGSLVVNATGMGKDRPGSPVSDGVRFPERGVVWELNYRGSLDLLRQARDQAAARSLTVVDGWRYFLHGWAEHLAEAFGLDLTGDRFASLASAAEPLRPSA